MLTYRLYGSMPSVENHKIVAEISTSALEHNFHILNSFASGCRPISVVKADAYGHCADICVPVLLECGCDFFAVSCIEEAMRVREICDGEGASADIIILGYTHPALACELAGNNIIQTVLSLEYARALSSAAAAIRVLIW